MTKGNFKNLTDNDGKKYKFSDYSFRQYINRYIELLRNSGNKVTKECVYQEIANTVSVTIDAVKNWLKGSNGPGDIEIVKEIAEYLEVPYKELLTLVKEEEIGSMSENRDLKEMVFDYKETKDVIRMIYQEMAEFMDLATETLCFSYLSAEEYEAYLDQYNYLNTLLHKNMLDIPLDIYDRLENIISTEFVVYIKGYDSGMIDIWDGHEFQEFVDGWGIENIPPIMMEDYQAAFMRKNSKRFYAEMKSLLKRYLVQ